MSVKTQYRLAREANMQAASLGPKVVEAFLLTMLACGGMNGPN
jgi:hypothetical protein